VKEGEAQHDETEAIKGKSVFTPTEVKEGLQRGYLEVDIESNPTRIPMRDPFLAYALLLAQFSQ